MKLLIPNKERSSSFSKKSAPRLATLWTASSNPHRPNVSLEFELCKQAVKLQVHQILYINITLHEAASQACLFLLFCELGLKPLAQSNGPGRKLQQAKQAAPTPHLATHRCSNPTCGPLS